MKIPFSLIWLIKHCLGHFKTLLSLLFITATFLGHTSQAQVSPIAPCGKQGHLFSGAASSTLCEDFPNFTCTTTIGAGTAFAAASQIGSSISGNVCIIGDFIIDQEFWFSNAIVKVSPGVKITVDPNIFHRIENSTFFACNNLWQGYELDDRAVIYVFSSRIDDAKRAIYSDKSSYILVNNTVFNRNRVGIYLDGPLPYIKGFYSSEITCNAPLNGTIDQITFAGIQSMNQTTETAKNLGS